MSGQGRRKKSYYESFRQMLRDRRMGPATWGMQYNLPSGLARQWYFGKAPLPEWVAEIVCAWGGRSFSMERYRRQRIYRQLARDGLTLSEYEKVNGYPAGTLYRMLNGAEEIPKEPEIVVD